MKDLFSKILIGNTDPFESIMEKSLVSPQTQQPIMGGTVEFASEYMPPEEYHPSHDLKKHCDEFGNIVYNRDETKLEYSEDEIDKLLHISNGITDYIKALKGDAQEPLKKPQEKMPKDFEDAFTKKDVS